MTRSHALRDDVRVDYGNLIDFTLLLIVSMVKEMSKYKSVYFGIGKKTNSS